MRIVTSHPPIGAAKFTTDVRFSEEADLSINLDGNPGHLPYHSSSNWSVGGSASLYFYTQYYVTKDGPLVSPNISIQWLRSGVAIPGATSDSYTMVAADYNKLISARLTIRQPGYVPLVYTTTNPQSVALGIDNNAWIPVVVDGPGNGVLTASVTGLFPATPTPTYTYKWYRDGVAIAGATAKSYTLVGLDKGKLIKVQVTMTRAGFEPLVQPSKQTAEAIHTIFAGPDKPTITGTKAVGSPLVATPPAFFSDAGLTMAIGITPFYTWYRSGTAIAGATADTYTLTSADLGKVITVKVVARQPGYLAAASVLSDPTPAVVSGTIDLGTRQIATSVNLTTRKATVSFTGTAGTSGLVATYKWYRNGVAISGATASSYVLLATDTNKAINVVVRLTKPGFVSYTFPTPTPAFGPAKPGPGLLVNGFTQGENAVIVGTANVGNSINCVPPLYVKANGTVYSSIPVGAQTLKWTRDNVVIAGATGFDYIVVAEDSGTDLRCQVTIGAPLHKTQVELTDPMTVP